MDKLTRLLAFLDADPDDGFTRFAIAMEHVKAGDDAMAADWLGDILRRDPAYIGAYYHLGKCLERLGNPAEARRTYIRGIEYARLSGDTHAASELTGALEELD